VRLTRCGTSSQHVYSMRKTLPKVRCSDTDGVRVRRLFSLILGSPDAQTHGASDQGIEGRILVHPALGSTETQCAHFYVLINIGFALRRVQNAALDQALPTHRCTPSADVSSIRAGTWRWAFRISVPLSPATRPGLVWELGGTHGRRVQLSKRLPEYLAIRASAPWGHGRICVTALAEARRERPCKPWP